MLKELNIPTLQSRRKDDRLIFLYMISEGLIPAIPQEHYLNPIVNKRKIKAEIFENCVTTNFVNRRQTLNKNSYTVPDTISEQYKNSFFPRTIPEKWLEKEANLRLVAKKQVKVMKNREFTKKVVAVLREGDVEGLNVFEEFHNFEENDKRKVRDMA